MRLHAVDGVEQDREQRAHEGDEDHAQLRRREHQDRERDPGDAGDRAHHFERRQQQIARRGATRPITRPRTIPHQRRHRKAAEAPAPGCCARERSAWAMRAGPRAARATSTGEGTLRKVTMARSACRTAAHCQSATATINEPARTARRLHSRGGRRWTGRAGRSRRAARSSGSEASALTAAPPRSRAPAHRTRPCFSAPTHRPARGSGTPRPPTRRCRSRRRRRGQRAASRPSPRSCTNAARTALPWLPELHERRQRRLRRGVRAHLCLALDPDLSRQLRFADRLAGARVLSAQRQRLVALEPRVVVEPLGARRLPDEAIVDRSGRGRAWCRSS